MRCYACRISPIAAAVALTLFAGSANAQKSAMCDVFDHKSAADHKSVLVIQTKPEGGVRDPELLKEFSLRKLLESMLKRSGSEQTPEDLIATLIESFRKDPSAAPQPTSGLDMPLDTRPGEAAMSPADLLNPDHDAGLIPIGFFNRFDLNAFGKNGHCGEARIVYSRKVGIFKQRFFLIFEGKATPKAAANGEVNQSECRPFTEFWVGLKGKSGAVRGELMRKLYFDGDLGGGKMLAAPPMSFESLGGLDRGQVRGNIFVDGDWQLREWLLRRHVMLKGKTGEVVRLQFDVTTVKDNPWAEFNDIAKGTTGSQPARRKGEATGFQTALETVMVTSLAARNLPGGSAVAGLDEPVKTVHGFGFGAGATNRYDEFQSTSQGSSDIVSFDLALKSRIDKALQSGGSNLTSAHIFDRSMALSCQGCHQPGGEGSDVTRPQNFKLEIAPGVIWPASLSFVHIDEESRVSPALTDSFFKFRAAMLEDHLCQDVGPVVAGLPETMLRKVAPAPMSSGLSVEALSKQFGTAQTAVEKSAIQDALNIEGLAARAAERSQPGGTWPFRRTH